MGAWIANKLLQPVQQVCNICPTRCHCVFQHTLLWKPQAFFLHTPAVMVPSILHAHKLWRASLLQKQARLLQSQNLKTRFLIVWPRLLTALIISSHAHSLCDHGTQQSATLTRSHDCIMAEKHVSQHDVPEFPEICS